MPVMRGKKQRHLNINFTTFSCSTFLLCCSYNSEVFKAPMETSLELTAEAADMSFS